MDITERQMQIVRAAIGVIARQGYEKLTTKNLAKSLGVSEATLYKHFSSKKELISMILCYFQYVSCQVIEQIKSQDIPPIQRIRRFAMNRYELFTREPDLAMVMFSEELFKNDHSFEAEMMSIMSIHRDEVIGYVMQGQRDGQIRAELNPMHIFRIIVGSMRLLVTQWNFSHHAFDLIEEGKAQLNTIVALIELRK